MINKYYMQLEENPTGITEPEIEETTTVGLPLTVILFNDDWHTFDEVIVQLMKAVNCSFEQGRNLHLKYIQEARQQFLQAN